MRISDWSSDVCSSDLTAFAAGDTRHFVRLVEYHHAVEIIADPVEDLLKASTLVPPVGAERRIREEEHTLGRTYGRAQLPLIEMLDVERETADRGDRKRTRRNSSH